MTPYYLTYCHRNWEAQMSGEGSFILGVLVQIRQIMDNVLAICLFLVYFVCSRMIYFSERKNDLILLWGLTLIFYLH